VWATHLAELCCPSCRGELALGAGTGWVEDGALRCEACQTTYPVTRGVPRLLPASGASQTSIAVDARTRESFGFEWLRYPVTSPEEDLFTLLALTGVQPDLFERVRYRHLFAHQPTAADMAVCDDSILRDRRVAELGCGMGKYVAVVARAGATIAVGLDASDAVERAVTLNRERSNALIVQGDIFHPPLRGGFDFAYSVGVLHHTPDAHRAFSCVAPLVAQDGSLAVWLYPRSPGRLSRAVEWYHDHVARAALCRLPHAKLERVCAWLGRLTVTKTRLRERGGAARGLLASLLNVVAVGEHLDPGIAAFLNFDWYSPPYRSRHTAEELRRWYVAAGFEEPRILPEPVSALGRRPRHAPPTSEIPS
jgi:uncharacterized protein YbaR (Trm112 family)/SAM-dependent methyltransferase